MAVVDQALNQKLEGLNPVMAILNPQIQFNEPSQKFVIRLNPPFALPSTSARGSVNVTDGNLQIMPDEADKNSLVWYFLSPQALSKHLTNALRGWVARDAPGNKINRVEIEGTTLFIRLAGCSQDDPACNPHRQS
jgi:hypothetical protein